MTDEITVVRQSSGALRGRRRTGALTSGVTKPSSARASRVATIRTTYECDVCGTAPPKWVGRCPDCGAWGSVVEATPPPRRRYARSHRADPGAGPADRDGQRRDRPGPDRPVSPELDRVLGGGLVPGRRRAAGRGAGRRQVDTAARRRPAMGGRRRRGGRTSLGRERRGVGRPRCGCGPSGSAPCTNGSTSPPRPTSPQCSGHLDEVKPGLLVRRLGADASPRPAPTACPAGSPRCGRSPRPRRGGQGARHRDRAGGTRHQGRPGRRPPGARAPGRRRAPVRGRQVLVVAPGPRPEEPLRRGRRGGLLRDA